MKNKGIYTAILILAVSANANAADLTIVPCNNITYIKSLNTTRDGDNWYSSIKLDDGKVYKSYGNGSDASYALNNQNGIGKILHAELLTAASMDTKVILEDDTGWKCVHGFNHVKVFAN
jgi:hypothetical protein